MVVIGDLKNDILENENVYIIYHTEELKFVLDRLNITRNDLKKYEGLEVSEKGSITYFLYNVEYSHSLRDFYENHLSKNRLRFASKLLNLSFYKNKIRTLHKDPFTWNSSMQIYKENLKELKSIVHSTNINTYRKYSLSISHFTTLINRYYNKVLKIPKRTTDIFKLNNLSVYFNNGKDIGVTNRFYIYSHAKWDKASIDDRFNYILNSLYIRTIIDHDLFNNEEELQSLFLVNCFLNSLMYIMSDDRINEQIKLFIIGNYEKFIEEFSKEEIILAIENCK